MQNNDDMISQKKAVTLDDIAKEANVSKMTVSRVLNGKLHVAKETKDKVERIIRELGYQPNLLARSLSSKKTLIVGVVLNKRDHMFMYDYTTKILSGIMDVAIDKNYKIMLCPIENKKNNKGEYHKLVRSKMLDGLILLKRKEDDPYISELIELEFPFVMLNYKKYSDQISFVDAENYEGAQIAVNYLNSKGHEKIAFVRGRLGEPNSNDRFLGYKDALIELGLKYKDDWVINGEFDQEIAYLKCDKLLKLKNPPTAIFCADDNMAVGVMRRLRENNIKIPEEMALMGFDDILFGSMCDPKLTTIRQPIYEIGKSGMELLFDIINGNQENAVHKLLPVELVTRESV